MTAACLKLLAVAGRPMWPWGSSAQPGILVEAFPAAQLRQWDLQHWGYQDRDGTNVRRKIIETLRQRIELGSHVDAVETDDNALDSVLAAFAGIAVFTGNLAVGPLDEYVDEGWIAVHE